MFYVHGRGFECFEESARVICYEFALSGCSGPPELGLFAEIRLCLTVSILSKDSRVVFPLFFCESRFNFCGYWGLGIRP